MWQAKDWHMFSITELFIFYAFDRCRFWLLPYSFAWAFSRRQLNTILKPEVHSWLRRLILKCFNHSANFPFTWKNLASPWLGLIFSSLSYAFFTDLSNFIEFCLRFLVYFFACWVLAGMDGGGCHHLLRHRRSSWMCGKVQSSNDESILLRFWNRFFFLSLLSRASKKKFVLFLIMPEFFLIIL